ncbi:MAG TPA: class I SAM-dependent methyltransferase [Acidimicrobiales bacterium]|nr:class I SAM-dependent methyltransferase [Acidimicrobiales bacterium]
MTTYAPDGSPVEAFAVLPPGPAPELLDNALPPAATVLDLGGGAGRIAHALVDRGHRVTVVDQSQAMLDHVDETLECHLADIEELDLGRTFDAVLLASFLVNTPHEHQRDEFLATCKRHVTSDGSIYVQRLDPELVPLAIDAESEEGGVTYAMSDVRHDGAAFAATMAFTIGGEGGDRWQHRYEGVVLDDDDLVKALAPHQLRITGYLDDQRTWVEIRTA